VNEICADMVDLVEKNWKELVDYIQRVAFLLDSRPAFKEAVIKASY